MIAGEADARAYCSARMGPAGLTKLERLEVLLAAENARQNLVARSSLQEVWRRHFADSAQLAEYVPRGTGDWLDLGSGGGFPGLVVAIAEPQRVIVLVESRKLRVAWLRAAADELRLGNVVIIGERLEDVASRPVAVISARAFAPLGKLLTLSTRFSTPETVWVLPKGRSARQELDQQDDHVRAMFHVEQSLTDAEAGILVGRGGAEAQMIRVAIANQKGGVGKTTTAVNIATAVAAAGWRTMLIDLDPQGNASTGLGCPPSARERSSYDLMVGDATLDECLVTTEIPNLDLIPATVDLSGAEVELVGNEARTTVLSEALASTDKHQICFIDCPPSLGLLTLNALVAADHLLVPLQCEFFALEGLSQLLQTVEQVKRRFNSDLAIVGIVLTMFDRRNRLTDQVADDVRETLGSLVFDTVIPRNVRLSEAPSHGVPALVYDHQCAGSRAYIDLAREMIERINQVRAPA